MANSQAPITAAYLETQSPAVDRLKVRAVGSLILVGKTSPVANIQVIMGGNLALGGGAYGFVEMVFQKLDTLQLWGLRMGLLAETKSCYICKIFKSLRTNGNSGFC